MNEKDILPRDIADLHLDSLHTYTSRPICNLSSSVYLIVYINIFYINN